MILYLLRDLKPT